MVKLVLGACVVVGCGYRPTFEDCTIRCDTGCPDTFTCGAEGRCRAPGATGTCATVLGDAATGDASADAPIQFSSCAGLAPTCGPDGSDDCCSTAMPIPGGTFYRSYDEGSDDAYTDMSYPATVSPFLLDKYEVTVGRFRAFVATSGGTQVSPPAAGAGARTLNGSNDQGGWDPSWDDDLAVDATALKSALQCDAAFQTWTDAPSANESLAINCVTWYEAMAFCAWDGGYLPSEAEWNFAAAGGDEQRTYPWSTPPSSLVIDCSYANYQDGADHYCVPGSDGAVAAMNRVGSESPKGDGKWGQCDLGGNAAEWVLDWYAPYADPCNDCANLVPGTPADRVARGGDFEKTQSTLRAASRGINVGATNPPNTRLRSIGFRCARSQ